MIDKSRTTTPQVTSGDAGGLDNAHSSLKLAPGLGKAGTSDKVKRGNGADHNVEILKTLLAYVVQSTFATKDGKPLSKANKEAWHPADEGVALDLTQLVAHAAKKKVIAAYPMAKGDDKTRVGVYDFDDHDKKVEWPDMIDAAKRVCDRLEQYSIFAFPVRSRRGRGIHLWMLFSEPVPAAKLRAFLNSVLADCGFAEGRTGIAKSRVEIIPKQDDLKPDGIHAQSSAYRQVAAGFELGGHICLPFAGDSVALDPETFEITDRPRLITNGRGPILTFQMDEKPAPEAEEQAGTASFNVAKLKSALAILSPDDGAADYERRLTFGSGIKTSAVDAGFDLEVAYKIWADWTDTTEANKPKDDRRKRRWNANFKILPKGHKKRIPIERIYREARRAGWTWAGDDEPTAPGSAGLGPNGTTPGGTSLGGTPAPAFSEEYLALLFTAKYEASLRYVAKWGTWLRFTDTVWEFDDTRKAWSLAREICRGQAAQINKGNSLKRTIASAKTRAAVISLASDDPRHAATIDQWDTDPWLLNTPGGVIDLRTGVRRDHRAEDYLTKLTAVAPDAACPIPLWKAFLSKVTNQDEKLEGFIQRALGYSLTGSIKEHALFFCYGAGGNGKGVLASTISGIHADYHRASTFETFAASKSNNDRHPTELAALRGARFVTVPETEQGRRWNETRIKQLTGGDLISARFMRQDLFDFLPAFKLWILGNHKPSLDSVNEAIRRRLYLIPFLVTITDAEKDKDLVEKLKAEWPGILAWLIEGCLEWQRDGLAPPQAVIDATADYLKTEDRYGMWLEECFDLVANEWTSAAVLFESWQAWATANNEWVGSKRTLGLILAERHFIGKPIDNHRGFIGLRPKGRKDTRAPDQEAEIPF
jgi:putative DNA primase/helicase